MTEYYSTYNNKDKNEQYIWASRYQPDAIISDPGSGSNPNSQLVRAISTELPWPVSRRGGQLQHIGIMATDYYGWSTYLLETPQEQREEQVLTTKDKLEGIRDIFGLSISHLAKVLCISRPSLHSWLEGMEPRDQSIERINQIYQIAKTWKDKSPFHYSPGRLMRQPLGNGASILECLERENLIDIEIQDGLDKLFKLMQRQRDQMDRSKKRSLNSVHPDKVQVSTRHGLTKTVSPSSK